MRSRFLVLSYKCSSSLQRSILIHQPSTPLNCSFLHLSVCSHRAHETQISLHSFWHVNPQSFWRHSGHHIPRQSHSDRIIHNGEAISYSSCLLQICKGRMLARNLTLSTALSADGIGRKLSNQLKFCIYSAQFNVAKHFSIMKQIQKTTMSLFSANQLKVCSHLSVPSNRWSYWMLSVFQTQAKQAIVVRSPNAISWERWRKKTLAETQLSRGTSSPLA